MGRIEKKSYHMPICVFFTLCVLCYYFNSGSSSTHLNYGLMFDAGSTGSRIHVYSFDVDSGKLMDEIFKEVKPGLSSYSDPVEAAKSLKPLLDIAVKSIPKKQQKCTPLALKATAGLRRIGEANAQRTLSAVRDFLAGYDFHMEKDAVEIMKGSDEGVFAWITVNQLLGRFDSGSAKKTVSIMDLGGGSTQIVFEPTPSSLASAPDAQKYKLKMGTKTYELYQNSYEGYGLNAAREQIFAFAAGDAAEAHSEAPIAHPCIPQGHTDKTTLDSKEYSLVPGRSSFAECARIATAILKKDTPCEVMPCSFNGVFQPRISDRAVFDSEMYAFSYFYDRTQLDSPHSELTIGQIQEQGQAACSGTAKDPQHGVLCADLSFIYALLTEGYSLESSQKLQIAKKIDGFETAWALGAMVTLMKNIEISSC